MAIMLNERDVEIINEFKNDIKDSIKNDFFYTTIIKSIFNEKTLLPEEIHALSNEIKNSRFLNSLDETKYISTDLGFNKIGNANLTLQESKNILLKYIALKEQLDEYMNSKEIFNSAIDMIRKAMAWMNVNFPNVKNSNFEKIIIIKKSNDSNEFGNQTSSSYNNFPFINHDYPDEEYQ